MKKVNIRGLYYKGVLPKMRTLEVDDELFEKLMNNPSRELFVELLNIDPQYLHLFRRFQVQYNGEIIYSTKVTPYNDYTCDSQPWDEEHELRKEDYEDREHDRIVKSITDEQILQYRKGVEAALRKIAINHPEMNYDEEFIHHEAYEYLVDEDIVENLAYGGTPEEYADIITM